MKTPFLQVLLFISLSDFEIGYTQLVHSKMSFFNNFPNQLCNVKDPSTPLEEEPSASTMAYSPISLSGQSSEAALPQCSAATSTTTTTCISNNGFIPVTLPRCRSRRLLDPPGRGPQRQTKRTHSTILQAINRMETRVYILPIE